MSRKVCISVIGIRSWNLKQLPGRICPDEGFYLDNVISCENAKETVSTWLLYL